MTRPRSLTISATGNWGVPQDPRRTEPCGDGQARGLSPWPAEHHSEPGRLCSHRREGGRLQGSARWSSSVSPAPRTGTHAPLGLEHAPESCWAGGEPAGGEFTYCRVKGRGREPTAPGTEASLAAATGVRVVTKSQGQGHEVATVTLSCRRDTGLEEASWPHG